MPLPVNTKRCLQIDQIAASLSRDIDESHVSDADISIPGERVILSNISEIRARWYFLSSHIPLSFAHNIMILLGLVSASIYLVSYIYASIATVYSL